MPRNTRYLIQTLALFVLAPFLLLFGNLQNPPPGKTGAPGDGSCAECHTGTATNPGVVIMDFGKLTYSPGVKQRLSVHVLSNSAAQLTGFQVTARLASDETQQAGHFEGTASAGVQIKDGIEYISHSTISGAKVYTFDWTPPPSGDVKFYVSAVAGVSNGVPDPNVYTNSYTIPAAQRVLTGGHRWQTFDYPGAVTTTATGISESGMVTGYYRLSDNLARGFIRDTAGGLTSFSVPGAKHTMPQDVSNGGQIVGTYIDGSDVPHGFVRTPNGTFTTYDVPGSTAANPTNLLSLNEAGAIAGDYTDTFARRHAISRVTPSFQFFDVHASVNTYATGISNSGAIVGGFSSGSAFHRATSGKITGITMCEPQTALGVTYSIHMNDNREIAGNCHIPTGAGTSVIPFLSGEDGRTLRFNSLTTSIGDINNAGQIAATESGHGVLMTPCLVNPLTQFVTAPPTGGTQTLGIGGSQQDCRANVISESSWITVEPPKVGPISFSVTENTTGVPRTGTIWVGGFTVNVTQQAGACDFIIAGPTTVGAEGGSITLSLTGSQNCIWNPRSSGDWVSFPFPNGAGNGTLTVTFAANANNYVRTAVLTIGTTQYLISQSGYAGCGYVVAPTSISMPSSGGYTTVYVYATTSCGWSVTNNTAWIYVQPGYIGYGSGSVTVYVNASGEFNARTGTLQIANQTIIITQAGTGGGSSSALRFIPVTPCRIADTRDAARAAPFGAPRMQPNTSRDLPIPQAGCGIPAGVQAYSLNITAVPPGPLAFITTYPTGTAQPLVSTLNSLDGRVVANAAIVPAGSNSSITVYVSNETDVVVDINGYFTSVTDPNGLVFYPVTPCRIADTRPNSGKTGAYGAPSIASATSRTIPIAGAVCNIPSNARAFSLNATAVAQGYLGFLTLYPSETSLPFASTLNSWNGQTVANAAIVPAGTSGGINVYASNTTDFVLDINGYFAPPGFAGGLNFYTLSPCRVADTRNGSGMTGSFGPPRIEGNTSRDIPVTLSACGAPSSALAYSVNVTAVPPGPLAYITAYPAGTSLPLASTLNAFNGQVVANAALVPAGTNNAISFFASDPTNLVLDINGYFAP